MSITHIPFYPSDWLAGTRGMTAEETGVYITLTARMYEMAAPIERDDERLYRICGCKSKRSFVKTLEYLVSEGKVQEANGALFNERVEKEINKVVEKSTKARGAAQSRWDRKPNKINGSDNAGAMRTDMLQLCQPEPKPEPIKKHTKRFDEFWALYPKKAGKKVAERSYNTALKSVDHSQLMDGLRQYVTFRKVKEGYILNPATWLNGGHWDDEEDLAPNGATSKADMYRSMK